MRETEFSLILATMMVPLSWPETIVGLLRRKTVTIICRRRCLICLEDWFFELNGYEKNKERIRRERDRFE